MCAAGERCELCGAGADVHCRADAAFLCWPCDAEVHGANTLASRHRRTRVSQSRGVVRVRCEVALEGWARRMGLEEGAAHRCAEAAARVIRTEVAVAAPRMPLLVAMAAALWWEVAAHGVHEPEDALQRLEASAHVPARLLVAVAAAIGRARARKRTAAVNA
ncbi:hypothetical protein CFC21_096058 [Triticum aestivum]|uniref:B box-type domain-containing protein n=2 Tax=Triticum aestivum TaxID=4565 RepID=A0A9R1MY11_WHEAT|nr:zinc finger protein CONSTANS-LIKE 1-like [Triticum dicoccoides]XP_044428013.1 zinc finger protein CONSTANS-LIKE 1-like [Triticum aestivum]XP_048541510.1 zinc finger protein CONSTANS-LIKE 1-like [Triticum urartu]KAF7093656.1 hypothetical protein CFC21_096058 [Triticum aestivum]